MTAIRLHVAGRARNQLAAACQHVSTYLRADIDIKPSFEGWPIPNPID